MSDGAYFASFLFAGALLWAVLMYDGRTPFYEHFGVGLLLTGAVAIWGALFWEIVTTWLI